MSTPRFSIIAGPAQIRFKGQTIFATGDVSVSTRVRAFAVAPSGRPAQRREDQVEVEIAFTPDGAWGPMCALMQELAALAVGQDVFGTEDAPVAIDSSDGWTYTYASGALTGPPAVVLSAGRTLFGPATITALGARGGAPTEPGWRVVMAVGGYPEGGSEDDPAARVVQPYTLSWGSSAGWTNLAVADGVELGFAMSLAPRRVDGAGVIGLRLADLVVTARAVPLGVADADVLAAWRIQGQGAGRGRALGGGDAADLIVAGARVYARLNGAWLDAGRSEFGAGVNRVGELGWTASVTAAAPAAGGDGAWRPLFFLGTAVEA